jgi:hypothetical protein
MDTHITTQSLNFIFASTVLYSPQTRITYNSCLTYLLPPFLT